MNTTDFYRSYLYQALAKTAQMNDGQVQCLLNRYEKLAAVSSDEFAFATILESYGNENTAKAAKTVKDQIQEALEKASKESVGIDKNPISRMIKNIAAKNKKLKILNVGKDGQPILSDSEMEKVLVKVPEFCKVNKTVEWNVRAFASEEKQDSGLELIVRFDR